MMKQAMALMLAMSLLPVSVDAAPTTKQATVAVQNITVHYNGKALAFPDQKPAIRSNRTLVPIRPIAESLGFKVTWNNNTRTVTIIKGTTTVNLVINEATAKKNAKTLQLDAPAQIINSRTMVPVRFIAEALNYAVGWDNAARTVKITDRQVYGRLDNVVVYQDEAEKQWKVLVWVFFGPNSHPLADTLKEKVADDTLFGRYLMAKYADTVKVTDAEVKELVGKIKERALYRNGNDQKAVTKEMAQVGISEQDIYDFALIDKFTTTYAIAQITDADVEKHYNEHKAEFTLASVRHILVDTEAEAKATIARLNKGEKFADLAKELSKDPGSSQNGGLYQHADVSKWVAEFRDASLTQPINQVGQPVKTQFGYHVILVEERITRPIAEAKDQIMRALVESKTKELRAEVFTDKTK